MGRVGWRLLDRCRWCRGLALSPRRYFSTVRPLAAPGPMPSVPAPASAIASPALRPAPDNRQPCCAGGAKAAGGRALAIGSSMILPALRSGRGRRNGDKSAASDPRRALADGTRTLPPPASWRRSTNASSFCDKLLAFHGAFHEVLAPASAIASPALRPAPDNRQPCCAGGPKAVWGSTSSDWFFDDPPGDPVRTRTAQRRRTRAMAGPRRRLPKEHAPYPLLPACCAVGAPHTHSLSGSRKQFLR